MKIIFFGNPGFAAENLEYLHNNGIDIISIVSSPDKEQGRGKKIMSTAVKQKGKQLNINVLTPIKLKDDYLIKKLQTLNADLFVVVAFRILPKEVFQIPKMGTINLHTSLLPNYRGAAPINRVLINGEKYTGITTFLIDETIDGGSILLQEKIDLSENITAGQLHNILMKKGSDLLIKTINGIEDNNISPIFQKNDLATDAPKINKDLTRINWKDSAINIHNLIRGLSPVLNENETLKDVSICPGAWFMFKTSTTKIIRTKILLSKFEKKTNNIIGSLETDNSSFLKINLSEGSILIEKLQIAGKKSMNTSQFLVGNKIDLNWKIL